LAADRDVFVSLLNSAVAARKAGDASHLRSLVGAPGIGDNRLIGELFSKLQRLSVTRDSLTQGPYAAAATNPDVQAIKIQVESTTDDLIGAIRSQIATFNARISALDGLVARSSAEVSALPTTEAEEERLLQDLATTQRVSDQLKEEQQKARIAELAQGGKVDVIDLARSPAMPVASGVRRRAILGAFLAAALAIGFVFAREELSTSLRRQEDVERLLGLPTLGAIPSIRKQGLPSGNGLIKRLGAGAGKTVSTALGIPATSPAFESYRAIRTSLIFSNAVKTLKSVAVTSASPGDGKSTTVVNLARAFAQQGIKVLAVDLDLRRGSLHRLFNVPRAPGLTNAIAVDGTIASIVQHTDTENLHVVTTGVRPPNPGELLGSEKVRRLLLEAQEVYDLVIIDTPPVLAAADASVVGSLVDGVILLVRVGDTSKRAAKTAHDRLSLVGTRILGTVLNDPHEILEIAEHYYYYDYAATGSEA
jgi:tyrosine-protein kinase Etk/Wzc